MTVLSDALTAPMWRVTARIEGPGSVGHSLALSDDGRTLAIGDAYHRRVRIDTLDHSGWRGTDTVRGGQVYQFGDHLALSGDGTTLAVSAHSRLRRWEEVQVYGRTAAGWAQQAVIGTPIGDEADFGPETVALSRTGVVAVVGAPHAHGGKGTAFVYRRVSGIWRRLGTLRGPANSRGFGYRVGISGDGATFAVGAAHGGISVFAAPRGASGFARTRHFRGTTLALSADGRTLVTGGPQRSPRGTAEAGRAYRLVRFVQSQAGWRFGGILPLRASDIRYGASVAVDATGRRVLVATYHPRGRSSQVTADAYQRRDAPP